MSDPMDYAALLSAEQASGEESVLEVPVLVVGGGPPGSPRRSVSLAGASLRSPSRSTA